MIGQFLLDLHVGRPQAFGPLTVCPIWTASPASGLATGVEAELVVSETQPAAQVNWLHIANRGDRTALLLDGELLGGGWQHRVVAQDTVVDAGREADVGVACVEQHRWHGALEQEWAGRRASPSIRAALTGAVPAPVQSEVWQRVAAYEPIYGASPTSSYLDMARSAQPSGAPQYRPLPGQRGLIVGAGGYAVLAELFPSNRALRRHADGLLKSVLFDDARLANVSEPVPGRRNRRFVAHLEAIHLESWPQDPSGEIMHCRGETDLLVARGLRYAGRWAHLAVFNRKHQLVSL